MIDGRSPSETAVERVGALFCRHSRYVYSSGAVMSAPLEKSASFGC